MLVNPTVEKLHAMRLRAMAEAFTEQLSDPEMAQLSFEERFSLLVDRQWTWRENRALERRLKRVLVNLLTSRQHPTLTNLTWQQDRCQFRILSLNTPQNIGLAAFSNWCSTRVSKELNVWTVARSRKCIDSVVFPTVSVI